MLRLAVASLLALAPLSCKSDADGGSGEDGAGEDGASPSKGGLKARDCDTAKLTALTGSLRSAEDRGRRRDLVATHLADACKLPEPVSAYLLLFAAQPGTPDQRTPIPPASAFEGSVKTVCGEADLGAALGKTRGDERLGRVYDACKLSRFGLMDRDAFVHGGVASMAPWHALQWLQEQGLDDEDARSIALGLYDSGKERWARPGQTLVKVEGALPSVPSGPRVFVTPDALVLGEQTLATVGGDGVIDPSAIKSHLIGALFDQLAEEADKAKMVAGEDDWPAIIVLALDQTIRFASMVDILYTAGRAEYRTFALVADGEGGTGALMVEPPRFTAFPGAPPEAGPRLKVFIMEEGYRVAVKGEGSMSTVPRKGATLDYAALAERAKAHRKAHGATPAVVSAENSIPAREFIRTAQAVMGPGCGAGQDCVLGELIIEAGAG